MAASDSGPSSASFHLRTAIPDLLEAGVAAAAITIEAVLGGILLVVILVIVLGVIEGRGVGNGHDDRLAEPLLHARLGGFGGGALRGAVHEDFRAVLVADVAELAGGGERLDVAPVVVEERVIGA